MKISFRYAKKRRKKGWEQKSKKCNIAKKKDKRDICFNVQLCQTQGEKLNKSKILSNIFIESLFSGCFNNSLNFVKLIFLSNKFNNQNIIHIS